MACYYCHLQGRTLGDREVKAGVTELGFKATGDLEAPAVRRGVRAPPQQEGSRAVFPFLASEEGSSSQKDPAHALGTWENEQHPETWLPPRLTERFRIFRKHHTLGVKLRAKPPLEKPDCHPGRKQSPRQRLPKELDLLRNFQSWSSVFSGSCAWRSGRPEGTETPGRVGTQACFGHWFGATRTNGFKAA